jgi:hypothetical protein
MGRFRVPPKSTARPVPVCAPLHCHLGPTWQPHGLMDERARTWRVGPEPLFLFSPSLAALAHRTSLEGATTSLSDRRYGRTGGDLDHAYKTPLGLC